MESSAVGRTPRSAADALVGLWLQRKTGPGGPVRTRASALHIVRSGRRGLMRRWLFLLALGLTLNMCVDLNALQPELARHGMVVATEPIATDIGVAVLKSGGNAIDAAVAVGFAMAVTYPYAGNLGGGGFMLIRLADGRSTFIDFREKAPEKASHDMYL